VQAWRAQATGYNVAALYKHSVPVSWPGFQFKFAARCFGCRATRPQTSASARRMAYSYRPHLHPARLWAKAAPFDRESHHHRALSPPQARHDADNARLNIQAQEVAPAQDEAADVAAGGSGAPQGPASWRSVRTRVGGTRGGRDWPHLIPLGT
jgi:hypothetical protein